MEKIDMILKKQEWKCYVMQFPSHHLNLQVWLSKLQQTYSFIASAVLSLAAYPKDYTLRVFVMLTRSGYTSLVLSHARNSYKILLTDIYNLCKDLQNIHCKK